MRSVKDKKDFSCLYWNANQETEKIIADNQKEDFYCGKLIKHTGRGTIK